MQSTTNTNGMRGAPPLLWLYAALMLQPFVTVAALGHISGPLVGAALVGVVVVWQLLRGRHFAWVIAVVFGIVVLIPVGDYRLWAAAINVVALACLLTPRVRAYVSSANRPRRPRRGRSEPLPGASGQ